MSEKKVDSKKTYVGVVENNDDPKRIGRCQIRVLDVFDNFKVEDLPWASPWKDLNGNQFNIPDKGKVVTVVFENENINNPEYISSDHYNVNLENKLKQVSGGDYLSMKSLLYDHTTQIYVNEGEGLKLDHKFNNLNIKENAIDVNLKDNFGKINLGSPNSGQRAILGDNFTNWFDTFLNILMGSQGGGFLGNLAVPVVATPALISHIQLYFQQKDPKILSKNVYIVDNESVKKQERTEGVTEAQKGDTWNSTVEENKITTKEEVKFKPVEGSTDTTFKKPEPDAQLPPVPSESVEVVSEHPDIKVIIELIRMKKYKLYEKPFELNIVAVRNQCLSTGDKYSDEFVDKLYVLYKDNSLKWNLRQYIFSTVPGVEFIMSEGWISRQTTMSDLEKKYWRTKIGKSVKIKEVLKGISSDTLVSGVSNLSSNLKNGLTGGVSNLIGGDILSGVKDLDSKSFLSDIGKIKSLDLDVNNILSGKLSQNDITLLKNSNLDINKIKSDFSKINKSGIDITKIIK